MSRSAPRVSPITVFGCNAALSRLPTDRAIDQASLSRLLCAGRVTAGLLLEQIEKGAARVLVLACDPGCCRHEDGADLAREEVETARRLLYTLGRDPASISLELVDHRGSSRSVHPECVDES